MAAPEIATLAGGCFWCLEAVFSNLRGVLTVESGYTGGHMPSPTYEQVCSETTGHAEAVLICYDPGVISYRELLEVFYAIHDPTTLNRQGEDVGSQYRSAIFYHSPEQEQTARELIFELFDRHVFEQPILTEVNPACEFYPCEEYHHSYYQRNPSQTYCALVISPKLEKFRKRYADMLKTGL
jgi:peptide-methionine (S)-S-oxide reductase